MKKRSRLPIQRTIKPQRRWPRTGGYAFPIPPSRPATDAEIYWSPAVDPSVLILTPPATPAMPTLNIRVIPSSARTADEGLYVHFVIGVEHFSAICLGGRTPDGAVAAVTLIDQFMQDRVDAIVRFRDAVLHHRASPDTRLTPQRRQRLIESLRAIDARQAGATYQEIAEAVFGATPVNTITWKSTPLRDTVMRRTASGLDLVAGGYRKLLCSHRTR